MSKKSKQGPPDLKIAVDENFKKDASNLKKAANLKEQAMTEVEAAKRNQLFGVINLAGELYKDNWSGDLAEENDGAVVGRCFQAAKAFFLEADAYISHPDEYVPPAFTREEEENG